MIDHDVEVRLRHLLTERFDLEELRTLCFDVDEDWDDLRGEGKAGKARELIAQVARKNNLAQLVAYGRKNRPELDWPDVQPHPSVPPPAQQFETLGDLVTYCVQEKRAAEPRSAASVTQTTRVEMRSESGSGDDALGLIVVFAIVGIVLGLAWEAIKMWLFLFLGGMAALAYGVSIYLLIEQMGFPRWSFGGLSSIVITWAICLFGVAGLYVGVFRPLYTTPASAGQIARLMGSGVQMIGAAIAGGAVVYAAIFQTVEALIYRKALDRRLPNRFECEIWELRWVALFFCLFALVIGLPFVTGFLQLWMNRPAGS